MGRQRRTNAPQNPDPRMKSEFLLRIREKTLFFKNKNNDLKYVNEFLIS
jgi:hypothetical protein